MKHTRVLAALTAGLTLGACADPASAPPTPPSAPALAVTPASPEARVIPGRFIVTLREGASPGAVAREHGVSPDYVYTHALNGFAGSIADAAREGLLRDARVARMEPDGIATTQGTQSGATWGLDRIDQRALPLNGTYSYTNTGSGVTAYIIDTGILPTHTEFGSRAGIGYTAISDGKGTTDCNGHGTHVAGTVGGATYGVAKGVTLVPVRVLDCGGSGAWSGVVAGIDWVVDQHDGPDDNGDGVLDGGVPAVSNMSLGGGASTAVDDAVKRMIADGVASAVAAGNGNFFGIAQDACKYSPARVAEAMTIGATDESDKKASFSNYGTCVDWFAPGVRITSAWYLGDMATNTISGTSMAAPHVAGAAALYLQSNPAAAPGQVAAALRDNGTRNVVTSAGSGSPNLLLYTGFLNPTSEPGTGGQTITLTVTKRQTPSRNYADLKWVGATNVDVKRNDSQIATVNGSSFTDNLNKRTGTFRYQVCNAGTATCSNSVSVEF